MNSIISVLLIVCALRPLAVEKEYREAYNKVCWYMISARTGMKYMESYRSKETWISRMIKNVEEVCKEYPLLPFIKMERELLGMLGQAMEEDIRKQIIKQEVKTVTHESFFKRKVYKIQKDKRSTLQGLECAA